MNPLPRIAEDDIRALPRWARVAFAVRWGRRVQPLLGRFWPNLEAEFLAAFDKALTLAEESCANARAVEGLAQAAAAADIYAKGSAGAQPIPPPGAGVAVVPDRDRLRYEVANAGAAAARAAEAAGRGDDHASTRAAVGTWNDVGRAGRAAHLGGSDVVMWYDFELLRRAARQGELTDETPIPPGIFGLETEIKTYGQTLPALANLQGRFVVIQGDEVAGTWETYADALQAGYDQFGLKPFLVKEIEPEDFMHFFPNEVEIPCLT